MLADQSSDQHAIQNGEDTKTEEVDAKRKWCHTGKALLRFKQQILFNTNLVVLYNWVPSINRFLKFLIINLNLFKKKFLEVFS